MAEKSSILVGIKTKPTAASVEDFLNSIEDEQKRNDSFVLDERYPLNSYHRNCNFDIFIPGKSSFGVAIRLGRS